MSPEHRLWTVVLLTAIHDLVTPGRWEGAEALHYDALRWFGKSPGRDFRMVCFLAGVDPVATHERLRRRLSENTLK
jgi:hypothetical protein